MNKNCLYFVVTFITIITGCATIVGDRNQLVGIRSNPDQAKLKVIDEYGKIVFEGVTPTNVTLKKGDGYFHGKDYKIEIAKDSFKKQFVEVTSHPNGWYILGNLVFGGLIGYLIVDPLTGAMWSLSPEQVDATLSQDVGANNNQRDTLDISILLLPDVPIHLRERMVPLK